MIAITKIKVNPGRREATPEHIREMAENIKENGLMNPITVDKNYGILGYKSAKSKTLQSEKPSK